MAFGGAGGHVSGGWLFPHSSTPLSDGKLEEQPGRGLTLGLLGGGDGAAEPEAAQACGGNKSCPVPTGR